MSNGLKAPAYAAIALSFASFGDAFLYPFLPLNNLSVQVSIAWVGVLLSINRFVRILSNTMMVHLFARYGLRAIMIFAVLLAIISTAGYAFATGVVLWLLFRICWGLSFSAMRIGTLSYALQHSSQGIALGVSRSLQEAGPMLALLIAPFLLESFNNNTIFLILATLSLPAIYFALALPKIADKTPATKMQFSFKFPSILNSLTFISAIVIDGIVVVVLGILFLRYRSDLTLTMATTLAAFYLAYRRICLVALSAAGGWIADHIGLDKVFNLSLAALLIGLFLITLGWVSVGAIIVFSFYSIQSALTPGSASKGQSHALAAVAENVTWRDIGAAVGTLLGGFLINSSHLTYVLLIANFALLILFLVHLGTTQKAFKLLYLWK